MTKEKSKYDGWSFQRDQGHDITWKPHIPNWGFLQDWEYDMKEQ